MDVLASEGHDAPRWGDFGWRVINLIIFAAILWHFIGGIAKRFFKGRRENIKNTLDELESRREKAKEELSSVEQRIANLDAERQSILDESRQQAENLKRSILEEAQRQAAQIVEQAKLTAESEGRAIIAELRATIADEIVDAAERALRSQLTPDQHERLITNSLNKVVLH
ncbi:MAG: ATP synthase F0 subunit B [Desulfovibrio sp.]|nr:ATP synthase F0 subunit B [Desulfovibrio sp.]